MRSPIASLVAHAAGRPDETLDPWRELVTTTAGLAFETDVTGKFTFSGPDPALGWSAAALRGQAGDLILADLGTPGAFNPFCPGAAARHRRAWLKRSDGSIACLSFTVVPLTDRDGGFSGARGIGIDLAELDATEAEVAAALRRADVLDHVLRSMRVELLPARMMQQALRALVNALGAEGAMVVDAAADAVESGDKTRLPRSRAVLHEFGGDAGRVLSAACLQLRFNVDAGSEATIVDGQPVIVCPCPTRFGGQSGVVVWRRVDARRWDAQDVAIVGSVAGLVRVVLEHGYVQSEMATHARTDALTGLSNRRAFFEEVPRHIDRLDRDRLSGTMMLVTLDKFRMLNELLGHDVGDEALRIATALLNATFRPGDIVARLGGANFAVWMNGADELTAAERAEALTTEGLHQFAHLGAGSLALGMSIGIAMRWPDGGEDTEELRDRADLALDQVKQTEKSGWRVWHEER